MDILVAPPERAALPERVASPGPLVTLWLLRTVVTLFLLAVLAQPVLAGLYLSGEFDALAVHAAIAGVVILLAMVLVGATLLFSTIGRGQFWPLPVAVAAFLAAGFQTGFGYARQLGLHIPSVLRAARCHEVGSSARRAVAVGASAGWKVTIASSETVMSAGAPNVAIVEKKLSSCCSVATEIGQRGVRPHLRELHANAPRSGPGHAGRLATRIRTGSRAHHPRRPPPPLGAWRRLVPRAPALPAGTRFTLL